MNFFLHARKSALRAAGRPRLNPLHLFLRRGRSQSGSTPIAYRVSLYGHWPRTPRRIY